MNAIRFHQKGKYPINWGPRGEGKERGTESLFKEIAENFPDLGKDLGIQVHKSNRTL